jgi:hypothetical protein
MNGESPGFNCRGPCPACKEDKTFIMDLVEDKILQELIKHELVISFGHRYNTAHCVDITTSNSQGRSSHNHIGWGDFNYTIYHTDKIIKTFGPFRVGYLELQFKVENGNIGFRYLIGDGILTVANTFIISLSNPKSIQKVHIWMEKVFRFFCDPKHSYALCRRDFDRAMHSYTRRLGHGDWINL